MLTTMEKLIVEPAPEPLGWLAVFTTPTSALSFTPIVAVPVLLESTGSAVVVVTVLVALTGPLAGTVNVTVRVTDAPTARSPSG